MSVDRNVHIAKEPEKCNGLFIVPYNVNSIPKILVDDYKIAIEIRFDAVGGFEAHTINDIQLSFTHL